MPDLLLSTLLALVVAGGAPAAPSTHSGPGPAWVAPLAPPLVILRPFAPPPVHAPWSAGHRGVDLAGAAGATVRADAAGQVTFAGSIAGQGVVVVAHSARLRSTFEPVRASVRVGDVVAAGTEIGRLETPAGPPGPGPSCRGRPCLHWGMLLDGRYIDPLAMSRLRPAPVRGSARLLPLDPHAGAPGGATTPSGPSVASTLALGRGSAGPPGGAATAAVGLAAASAGAGLLVLAARRRRGRA